MAFAPDTISAGHPGGLKQSGSREDGLPYLEPKTTLLAGEPAALSS